MDNKKIGSFLQQLRKDRKMTQLELATVLNVTHQSVSKWENGDSIPDIQLLSALAKFYQLSIEEILDGERHIQSEQKTENSDFAMINLISVSRLILSFCVLLSLFLFYLRQTTNLSDYLLNNNFDQFNNLTVTESYRCFQIIFNTISLTFFTGGAWIIFITSILLIIINGIVSYSRLKMKQMIKESTYRKTLLITQVILILGFVSILLGTLTNKTTAVASGYFVGLFLSISLMVIYFLDRNKIL